MKTTILLADDHLLFRQGLASLLRERADWEVVGEAADGEECVRVAAATRPDIAVLDVEMPHLDGIEATREILRVSPLTRVVALSMYGDPHHRQRMLGAGATAYVLKSHDFAVLVQAIAAVARGERPSPAPPSSAHRSSSRGSPEVDASVLTEREREVLRLLAEGRRNKEVAVALGISPKTVETYRARIMHKLRIDNLAGLVRFAMRTGIVSPGA